MVRSRPFSLLLVCIAAGACVAPAPTPVVRGPLPTRIQHPLAVTALAFRPRRAELQEPGSSGLALLSAYSSLLAQEVVDAGWVEFDGELASTSLLWRRGLAPRVDLELELPLRLATSGFLDGFVEGFHEALSLPDGGAGLDLDDGYEAAIVLDGETVYRLEPDRVLLGDVPLVLNLGLGAPGAAPDERWRGLLRLGIELPAGSEERGAGNGGIDLGVALSGERSRGRWTHFVGASAVHVAQPSALEAAGLRLEDVFELSYALEARLDDATSWVGQLAWRSPILDGIGVDQIEDPILDLGLGVVWDLGPRSRFTLSFHEDLVAHAGPDFTLFAGWSWGL